MKKSFIIFSIIIVTVYLVLSFFDKKNYAVEKRLWKTQKLLVDIAKDPDVIPEQGFLEVVKQYRKIIKKYPHADSFFKR